MPFRRLRVLAAPVALVVASLIGAPVAAQAGAGVPVDSAAAAAADQLVRALEAQRHPLRLADGRLVDRGGDLLLAGARAAEFVALGEDHGVAEVPALAGALFAQLRDAGYRHLAIETSPLTARRLEAAARAGGPAPLQAWQRAALEHPFELPFYSWREEMTLLERAVADQPAPRAAAPVLWGVDQEFVGASRGTLAWLAERAPTAEARRLVEALAARAARGLAAAAAGNRDELFLASAADSVFDRLRAHLPDSASRHVIDDLQRSREIYRLQFAGEGYGANLARERLIKRYLVAHLRAAERAPGGAGRVLVKLGADHLPRGNKLTAPLLSAGAFLSELAVARGGTSFHVLVLGGPASRSTGVGPGLSFVQTQTPSGGAAWMAPAAAAALPEGWTVFDLRPLRAPVAAGRLRPQGMLAQVIHGYDLLVLLTGSTPASF